MIRSCSTCGTRVARVFTNQVNSLNSAGQFEIHGKGTGLVTTLGRYPISSVKRIHRNGQLTRDGVCIIYEGMIAT